jgi:hypothetical protein
MPWHWQMARHSCLAAAGTDVRAARERDRDDKGWDWGAEGSPRRGLGSSQLSSSGESFGFVFRCHMSPEAAG